MRCRSCDATNPDGAAWCGQCYASLAVEAPAAEPTPQPAPIEQPADAQQPALQHAAVASTLPAPPGIAGAPSEAPSPAAQEVEVRPGFRRRGEDLEWQCALCDEFNSIDLLLCTVCGTPLSARYETREPEPERNWNLAVGLSAVLPGSGHIAVGRIGTGIARAVLFVAFAMLALPAVIRPSSGQSVIAVLPLVLGAAAVWGGTLLDILQLQKGGSQFLSARTLLWLTLGVGMLSLMMLGVVARGSV